MKIQTKPSRKKTIDASKTKTRIGESRKASGNRGIASRKTTGSREAEKGLTQSMDLLNETCRIAKTGGWEWDIKTGKQTWTDETYSIYEVGVDYKPTINKSLSFYEPGVLPIIIKSLKRAAENGKPFDLELPFITAKKKSCWVRLVGKIGTKGAKAVKVVGIIQDISDRKQKEMAQHNMVDRLRKALGAMIQAISTPAEKMESYTAGHQKRVADLVRAIAREMGLDGNRIDGIRMAAEIHDIGSTSVGNDILNKRGKLNDAEYSAMKKHPQMAYDILKDIKFPWPIARMILEHHEKVDGSGYPNGLTGEKLLMESKILAVADVVEAAASDRPYHPALGIRKALKELSAGRGILYDPEVVDACLSLFRDKKYHLIFPPVK